MTRGWCAAVVCAALFARIATGLFPYSGEGRPPMFGDFEAHRHWCEVTTALPLREWYRQGPDNDLQYWGLDYPPLMAYQSLAMGRALRAVEPASVELQASRGFEVCPACLGITHAHCVFCAASACFSVC
jgi:alpha-1,3-glucosyltransferase